MRFHPLTHLQPYVNRAFPLAKLGRIDDLVDGIERGLDSCSDSPLAVREQSAAILMHFVQQTLTEAYNNGE